MAMNWESDVYICHFDFIEKLPVSHRLNHQLSCNLVHIWMEWVKIEIQGITMGLTWQLTSEIGAGIWSFGQWCYFFLWTNIYFQGAFVLLAAKGPKLNPGHASRIWKFIFFLILLLTNSTVDRILVPCLIAD